jgi:hypothetical protein
MPGPATSSASEREAARAGRQRADGAASGSRRPSTTTPAATAPAPTRPGSRRGRSASSPQAEDHPISGGTRTCPPDARTRAAPTAISRASAQVKQVFGTHRLRRHPHALTQRRAWSPAMSSATFMCCISGARRLSYGAGSINWRPFRRSVPRALPRSACSVATGPRPLGWGYQLQLDIWCPVAGQSAASASGDTAAAHRAAGSSPCRYRRARSPRQRSRCRNGTGLVGPAAVTVAVGPVALVQTQVSCPSR